MLTEIRNRGVGDVLMVVCDGLKGLPETIEQTWPQTITQTCVVHLLRNSFRYAGRQHFDAVAKALRPVVRAAILDGRFPPGAALREVELSAVSGVSRGSVREGLAVLAREGLITSGWHRQTTVIEVTQVDVEEVHALRAALDRLAATTARQAAVSGDLTDLDRLVETMAEEVATGADPARLVTLDIAFHDRIYETAANRRLSSAWEGVRSQVHLFQLHRVHDGFHHYRDRVVDEHRDLARLIADGDPDVLALAAERHAHSARDSLIASLRSDWEGVTAAGRRSRCSAR